MSDSSSSPERSPLHLNPLNLKVTIEGIPSAGGPVSFTCSYLVMVVGEELESSDQAIHQETWVSDTQYPNTLMHLAIQALAGQMASDRSLFISSLGKSILAVATGVAVQPPALEQLD